MLPYSNTKPTITFQTKQTGSWYWSLSYFFIIGLSWTDANRQCKDLGARLPVILSASENAAILSFLVNEIFQPVKKGLGWSCSVMWPWWLSLPSIHHAMPFQRAKEYKTYPGLQQYINHALSSYEFLIQIQIIKFFFSQN